MLVVADTVNEDQLEAGCHNIQQLEQRRIHTQGVSLPPQLVVQIGVDSHKQKVDAPHLLVWQEVGIHNLEVVDTLDNHSDNVHAREVELPHHMALVVVDNAMVDTFRR